MDRIARRVAALERKAADPPDAGDVRREALNRLSDEDVELLGAFAKRWVADGGVGTEFTPEEAEAYARLELLQRQVRRDRRFSVLSPLLEADLPELARFLPEEPP